MRVLSPITREQTRAVAASLRLYELENKLPTLLQSALVNESSKDESDEGDLEPGQYLEGDAVPQPSALRPSSTRAPYPRAMSPLTPLHSDKSDDEEHLPAQTPHQIHSSEDPLIREFAEWYHPYCRCRHYCRDKTEALEETQ